MLKLATSNQHTHRGGCTDREGGRWRDECEHRRGQTAVMCAGNTYCSYLPPSVFLNSLARTRIKALKHVTPLKWVRCPMAVVGRRGLEHAASAGV